MIQWMLAIWLLVLLPFLNSACTCESSQVMYCWRLAWRILSITVLACEIKATVWLLEYLWHCPSLGLKWTLILSSSVATAEFSRFAGILSAAVYRHHLLWFEFSSAGIPSPSLVLFLVMLPKTHLTLYLTHFCTPHGAWKCPALTGWSFKMSQIKLTVIFYWKWWWLKIKKISWSTSRLEYSVGSHPYESLVTRSMPGINDLPSVSREETPDTRSFPLNW